MPSIASNSIFSNPLKSRNKTTATTSKFSKDPTSEEISSKRGSGQDVELQDQQTDAPRSESPKVTLPRRNLKIFSSGFSFFVAGTNDGSMGALLPYMLQYYDISTSLIALIYAVTFLGWLVAAATNSHAPKYFNLGALLAIGAVLQLLSQTLRPWKPPFPLFVITFFFSGLGQAYQDAHANTFVSSVEGAHNWLGFIHGMYGFGCLVAPFVATAVATAQTPSRWTLFYIFPLGLSVLNLVAVLFSFRESVNMVKHNTTSDGTDANQSNKNKSAMDEVRQMMKLRDLWLISLFFFFYLGVGTTAGGWVVQYLVEVRNGKLSSMGYVPSGFYGGLTIGRLLLAEPTHRFGELRMLLIYTCLSLVMQLIFWLVPNIISSAVVFSFMGFFLGPFFAAGVSVASRLLPKHIQPAGLGMIFVIAQAGGAIFPSLIGLIAARAGVKVLQPIVVALIVVMGITWSFVPKAPKRME